MSKDFIPNLNTPTKYTIPFSNALYNPHSGHNSTEGGILESSGFFISGDSNEMFLNDDGQGNVRLFYLVGGSTKTYKDTNAGTIDYRNGLVILTSLNITSMSNVDGVTSTKVRVIVKPDSNDIIAVRNQVLEIDLSNTSISGNVDTIATGGSSAGVGVATTSSYTGSSNTTTSTSTTSSSSSSSSTSSSNSNGY